jgi:hypothetical protein
MSQSDAVRHVHGRRGRRLWTVLLVSITVAGCAGGPHIAAHTGRRAPSRLLLAGPASHPSDPCQGSLFASECASAIGSAGISFDSPPVQEFVLEYRSAAAAAYADRSQQTTELSSNWLCSMRSMCPVTPIDVGIAPPPVHAVTFTIGQRGNLLETTRLAGVTKGSYVVNLSWLSASMVSANRVTPPDAARALLDDALGKIPA